MAHVVLGELFVSVGTQLGRGRALPVDFVQLETGDLGFELADGVRVLFQRLRVLREFLFEFALGELYLLEALREAAERLLVELELER